MFQNFNTHDDPKAGALRLEKLRQQMQKQELDAFLVPHEDAFMGEYVPDNGERLKWLTGFGGSSGTAVVLMDKASLFVDGRYVLQAPQQIDTNSFEVIPIAQISIKDWLVHALGGDKVKNKVIGFAPFLHTTRQIEDLQKSLEPKGAKLVAITTNPLDAVWEDQPLLPNHLVVEYPDKRAGKTSVQKRGELGQLRIDNQARADNKCDAFMLTKPESIAWLLNIRGSDVPHTPFALSYALLHKNGDVVWFINPDRVSDAVIAHIGGQVRLVKPEDMAPYLATLKTEMIGLDRNSANYAFKEIIPNSIDMTDPCSLPKACKTSAEIEGAIAAHIRDGTALCNFLCWLDENAPMGEATEISVAEKLETYRAETGQLLDLSFDTISGSGPNGAIVHYRVTKATNRALKPGDIYLVDSGGQYLDGTTDVTRTVLIDGAPPPPDAMMAFTRVLKGHIALATARFPKGTNGIALDALARAPLWAAGLDFDHGTGHGVGSYLCVHEGPQSISKVGTVALQQGMIVSNEPGYYREGAFGIRIENLQYVTSASQKNAEERALHGFETLTLAPIDRRLIDSKLMTAEEITWLNDYHQAVWEKLSNAVNPETQNWLKRACAPLSC